MNAKTTLLTAMILAALAAYIYRYERDPVESDVGEQSEKIFAFESDEIQEIEIRRAEEETVRLRRLGEETWQLVAPFEADGDSITTVALINAAASLERGRVVAEGEIGLADFGLDKPQLELELRRQDVQEPTTLLFGDKTPTGSNLYATLAGSSQVFVMEASSIFALEKSPWDLRDKLVVHFDRADVERVAVKQPGKQLVLARAGGDFWKLVEPTVTRADRYKASGLVNMLESTKMQELVSESGDRNLGQYGLAPPSYQVEIQLASGDSEILLVGAQKDDTSYYAGNPDRPLVYVIGHSVINDLQRDASEYMTSKLFEFSTYQANKFQIASADGTTRVFEKTKEDQQDVWKQTVPQARDMDTTAVEDFLFKLNGTDATERTTEATGLEPPRHTITVWSNAGANIEEVSVGEPAGDSIYARREGDELALKLPQSTWDEIEALMRFEDAPAGEQ